MPSRLTGLADGGRRFCQRNSHTEASERLTIWQSPLVTVRRLSAPVRRHPDGAYAQPPESDE